MNKTSNNVHKIHFVVCRDVLNELKNILEEKFMAQYLSTIKMIRIEREYDFFLTRCKRINPIYLERREKTK